MNTKITYNYHSDDLKELAVEFLKCLGDVAAVHLCETALTDSRCERLLTPGPEDFNVLPVINQAVYLLGGDSGVSIECSAEDGELEIELYKPLLKEHNHKTIAAFAAFQQLMEKQTAA